jgi:hypothetical protein
MTFPKQGETTHHSSSDGRQWPDTTGVCQNFIKIRNSNFIVILELFLKNLGI